MRVTSVRIYPVKSMGGLSVDHAFVEPWGLAGDRRWGVIDEVGEPVTAREAHALLGLQPQWIDDGAIRIVDRAGASIVVKTPLDAERIPVGHSRQGFALPAADEAHRWLSDRLGLQIRLVWQDDPTVRSVAEDRGGLPGEHLSLADAGPLLLASEASMAQLNAWIAEEAGLADPPGIDPTDISDPAPRARGFEPLSIIRFRPNVIIDGEVSFAEDNWSFVRIGEVPFRKTMVCDRCVMTTLDPVTLAGGKEPIRTLARHRRWDGKTWFGLRMVPLEAGALRVGDPVSPSATAAG